MGGELLWGEEAEHGAPILHVQSPRLLYHVLAKGDPKTSSLPFCPVVHIPRGSIHLLGSPKPGAPCRVASKSPWRSITRIYAHPHGVVGGGGVFPVGFGVAGCRCCSDFSLLPCLLQLRSRDPGEPQGNRSRPPGQHGSHRAEGVSCICSLIGNFTAGRVQWGGLAAHPGPSTSPGTLIAAGVNRGRDRFRVTLEGTMSRGSNKGAIRQMRRWWWVTEVRAGPCSSGPLPVPVAHPALLALPSPLSRGKHGKTSACVGWCLETPWDPRFPGEALAADGAESPVAVGAVAGCCRRARHVAPGSVDLALAASEWCSWSGCLLAPACTVHAPAGHHARRLLKLSISAN